MVELLLPKNSKVVKGDHYTEKGSKKSLKTFLIYKMALIYFGFFSHYDYPC